MKNGNEQSNTTLLALAVSSLVILAVHGVVFYKQFFHKWQDYQTAYFGQAAALTNNPAEKSALSARSPRIEQTIVTAFGERRVDRCATCHAAIDDPRFKDYALPLRSHAFSAAMGDREVNGVWERRHKFSDFGCTVCHDGQGRGLEEFYAHGEDHYWPEPLLGYVTQANWRADFKTKLKGAEYIQANCAQCHTEENFADTPLVTRGRQLFFEKNCYGCHRIEGLSNGTLGPDLTEAGKKFKVDYLWESVVEPRANIATSFMPKFALSDDDVKALVIFLKSRRGMNFSETSLDRYRAQLNKTTAVPATETGADRTMTNVALGERLVRDRSCVACHKLGDQDGGVAPDLSFEGLLKDETWIASHFRDPRSRVSDSIMPSFGFRNEEFQAMTEYLRGLNKAPELKSAPDNFNTLCARCHGQNGDGRGMIALYLDPAPRDLTKVAFMNSKPEDRFVTSILEGVPGTSMPSWKNLLSETQARELLNYINQNFVREPRREVKPHNVPEQNPVPLSNESVARGAGIYQQRCTGCHGVKADGKGPNSLDILPRPRNLRNSWFINTTQDRRLFDSILYGVQGTAMPAWIDYGLSTKDVGDLINYIRSLNQGQK